MRSFLFFFLIFSLSFGGYFWWKGKEGVVRIPTSSEENPPQSHSSSANSVGASLGEVPLTQPEKSVMSSSPPPQKQVAKEQETPQKGPKPLTQEERKLVLDISTWTSKRDRLIGNIQKLFARTQGAPVVLKPEDEALGIQHEELQLATENLNIPAVFADARKAVTKSDELLSEMVSSLSSPPREEELQSAMKKLIELTPLTNELNQLLNEVRYYQE